MYEVISLIVGLIIGVLATALYYERRLRLEETKEEVKTPYKPVRETRPKVNFSDPLDPVRPEPTKRSPIVFQKGIITGPEEDYDE